MSLLRKIFRSKRAVITFAAVLLLAVWALWYARPMRVHDLMRGQSPNAVTVLMLNASMDNQFQWTTDCGSVTFSKGQEEFSQFFSQLNPLRFHRNPLEIFLQFLPRDGQAVAGYAFDLVAYDSYGVPVLELHFSGEHWAHDGWLPLYASYDVESAGTEIGEWLWEHCDEN